MQAAGGSFQTGLTRASACIPQPDGQSPAAALLASQIEEAMSQAAESGSTNLDSLSGGIISSLVLLQPVAREGQCGNGVCEVGEKCSAISTDECCLDDCPLVEQPCPGDDESVVRVTLFFDPPLKPWTCVLPILA